MKIGLLAGVLFASLSLSAATTPVPVGVGEQGKQQLNTPRSGQTMDKVKEIFGEPQKQAPAVGDPPITRWIYQDFTVYFEYDRVIHAVKHRS
jgi:hypothetical protein